MEIDSVIELPISEYLKPFWRHWKTYPRQTNRHVYGIYLYPYKIDKKKLKDAVQNLSDHNYNLRSSFIEKNNELKWLIKSQAVGNVTVYSTSSLSEREILINALVAKPFHLSNEELYRIYLIEHADDEKSTLLIVFHHIIIDGVIFDELMRQLAEYYNNTHLNNQLNSSPSENVLQLYYQFEFNNLRQAQSSFWLEQIKHYPKNIDLKFINNTIPIENQQTRIKTFKLPIYFTQKLLEFSTLHQISLFNILKIIWASLIGRYCSQDKLIIVYPVSMRNKTFANLKGSFINVLPFALDLNTSLMEQIINHKHIFFRYQQNRFTPTQDLLINEGANIEGIFKIVISQTNLRINPPNFNAGINANNSEEPIAIPVPNLGSALLLLEYQCIAEEIHYHINFLSPAVSDEFIEQMGHQFSNLLFNALANPQEKLKKLHFTTFSNATSYPGMSACISHKSPIELNLQFYQHIGSRWPRQP